MTTIVNSPQPTDNSGGPWTLIIVLVVLAALAYLVYAYGLPAIRQPEVVAPQVNVPSTIDVNVKQTE